MHSGSMAVPRRAAKMMVAMREVVSWAIERRSADCGVLEALPTPTPSRTAREARRPAMELAKAWRESFAGLVFALVVQCILRAGVRRFGTYLPFSSSSNKGSNSRSVRRSSSSTITSPSPEHTHTTIIPTLPPRASHGIHAAQPTHLK